MKKRKRSAIKKSLWGFISKVIRMEFADDNGYVKCATCNTVKHYKELQAGHFIPQAQGDAIRYVEENIHPQCYRCNINLGGNGAEYYPYMIDMYGVEFVDELRQLSKTTRKFSETELLDMEAEWKARYKLLNDV
jgi:6-pyruvoyl-tetrahydropterin synthase